METFHVAMSQFNRRTWCITTGIKCSCLGLLSFIICSETINGKERTGLNFTQIFVETLNSKSPKSFFLCFKFYVDSALKEILWNIAVAEPMDYSLISIWRNSLKDSAEETQVIQLHTVTTITGYLSPRLLFISLN